jgi:glycosyltransferase involved in cell wall biosynthesis
MPEMSRFASLSVIIPTYNRENVLAKALDGYLHQARPELICELIVVDDGSSDDTESMIERVQERAAFPIHYVRQANKGPAAARNSGIRQVRSPLVLFTDSDIIPARNLVEQHVNCHNENPLSAAAVLGYVTWDPAVHPTPFMRWYGDHSMFLFDKLRNRREASFDFFYTCNISLKTEFLRLAGQFDEDFKTAAYEDTELGYRLNERGLKLLYRPEAFGYHHQFFSFEDACKKRLGNRQAEQQFFKKEAGRAVVQEFERKRSKSGYLLAAKVARRIATILHPVRRLLDSRVPLPHIVYRLFFWDSTTQSIPTKTSDVSDAPAGLRRA